MSAYAIPFMSGSCDESFDEEHLPLDDWKRVDEWNLQGNWKTCYLWASKQCCIGPMFKWLMSMGFAWGYEVAVCFIEAHEEASKMISATIDNKDLCEIILKEAEI